VAEDDGRVIPHDIIIENDHDTQKESTRLQFVAKNLPAVGYSTFYIRQSGSSVAPNKDSFEDGGTTIENEFLSINVDRNEGTLTLFDKRTGRSFSELNRYIDGGDAGDLRAYRAPQRDTIIDIPTNTPLQVLRTSGRTGQALEFLQIYRVPRSLAPDRSRRLPLAAQFVPISITTMIRVIRNIPRVDIEVQVSNNALDHRLRVHFPTGINTDVAFYDGHFEVVQRQVPKFTDPVFDSHGELSSQTHPQRAFVTVLGSDTGLTIANRGIPEVEILRNSAEKIDISLTLLRSTGWLRNDSMANTGSDLETPTAQCLGEHQFSYCLIPHGIDPVPAWHEAWAYQTPLEAAITDFHRGSLPLQDSLVSVDNPYFQISAVKPSLDGQGIIVRGYSISGEEETVNLHTSIPNQGVEIVNLDESPTGYAPVYQGADRYMFVSRPYEIVTLKFTVP
nr:hypothetical protein [Anaerolineae bacterium]